LPDRSGRAAVHDPAAPRTRRDGKPRSRILRLRAIVQWFIRHLRPAGVAAVPREAGALVRPVPGESPLEAESAL
jgi:hypothetical protein